MSISGPPGSCFVYLVERETGWKELSTRGSSSGCSGERRLGAREIPAKGRLELDWLELRSKGRG
jgi:hypothetical protein